MTSQGCGSSQKGDHFNNGHRFMVPRVVVVHRFECTFNLKGCSIFCSLNQCAHSTEDFLQSHFNRYFLFQTCHTHFERTFSKARENQKRCQYSNIQYSNSCPIIGGTWMQYTFTQIKVKLNKI